MTSVLIRSDLPSAHPLRVVRDLIDRALDDLGGLVAATDAADADRLPRRVVRVVMLQALCGVRADDEMAQRLNTDAGWRWFVGADDADCSAHACAQARRDVLGIAGFDEFLRVMLAILERRGLLADAMFAPAPGLLRAPAAGAALAPER